MNTEIWGMAGAVLCLAMAAVGSVLGTGAAGMAAIGAWKKNFAANKEVPFILIAFVGAPLTQTIYGCILMNNIFGTVSGGMAQSVTLSHSLFLLAAGIGGGIGIGASAAMQGKATWGRKMTNLKDIYKLMNTKFIK